MQAHTHGVRIPATVQAISDQDAALPQGRTVCVLLDGTGDMFDDDNSNVVKLFQALRKDDPRQVCYYQAGVGTYTSSSKGSLKTGLSSALDAALGTSVGTHIRDAYSFLMQTYREGDTIVILGFSRGAYTARALSGMLHKVGLLPAHNQAQLPFAYKWYKDDSKYGWDMSCDFKRVFAIDVSVHFLGCWDTVASVGFIPRILPFAKSHNTCVRYFRHALALDERRAKFKANHWYQRHPDNAKEEQADKDRIEIEQRHQNRSKGAGRGTHVDQTGRESHYGVFGAFDLSALDNFQADGLRPATAAKMPPSPKEQEDITKRQSDTATRSVVKHWKRLARQSKVAREEPARQSDAPREASTTIGSHSEESGTKDESKVGRSQQQVELMNEFNEKDAGEWGRETGETDVSEVWFCGAHADVGGGAVSNSQRHMASRIPLRWMIRETFKCNTGLLYRTDVLVEHGMDIQSLYPKLISRQPPVVGPAPSHLDLYASGKLASLEARRQTLRRALSEGHIPASVASTCADAGAATDHTAAIEAGLLPEVYEDYFDAQAPLNDQLSQARVWWILEVWPVKYRVIDGRNKWRKKVGMNLGRFRTVRDMRPQLHWTVIQRLQQQKDYAIRCLTSEDCVWDVVM
ncbi:unnamed protein product [Parajaminaea phylloscopi]